MRTTTRGGRFIGLHWKGFLWLSSLLLVLSTALHWLHHYHLMRQFQRQREAEIHSFHQQISGLVKGNAQRLVRLAGAVSSIEKLGEDLLANDAGQLSDMPKGAHYSGLGYELEVQRIDLFTVDGKEMWHWPETGTSGLPQPRIAAALKKLRREERPVTLLDCRPLCVLYAFVPVLSRGRNAGSLALGQSIADPVIEFKALTGADIGIVVPVEDKSKADLVNWGGLVSALTDSARLRPLLDHLTTRFPDPTDLDAGTLVKWEAAIYDVRRVPITRFMPGEAGFILLIVDVGAQLYEIQIAIRQGLLASGVALVGAELILLLLVRVPSRRLRWFAQTLPLLAQGAYDSARERFSGQGSGAHYRDEIDSLFETASTLSDQLQQANRALAVKNQELAEERDLVQGILDAAQVLIVTQTRRGIIQLANEYSALLTGVPVARLRGKRFVELIADVEAHREVLSKLEGIYSLGQRRVEHENDLVRSDGMRRQVTWVHTRLHGERPDEVALVSVGLDITERVQAEERMRWLANHDTLTGLVNRHRFLEELTRSYNEVSRSGVSTALLLFDLDHFKEINDTSGHAAGDALLRMIAEELRLRTRKSDIVARLGGDEFAVLMPNTEASGAETFAKQFNQRLADAPFVYVDKHYRVGASIGIVLLPEQGDDVQQLLANADIAMYEAKRAGRSRFFVYRQSKAQAEESVTYTKELLTQALSEKRLFFHFQPVVEAANGVVVHREALLRLKHADGRIALPQEFLPGAKRAGLMYEIDCFVAQEALRTLLSSPSHDLSINLSTAALSDARWAEPLKLAVRDHRLDPARLMFEITETATIPDLEKAKGLMEELADLGFRFALDDFGAGFSSLYYLRNLPVVWVKLDRSLVTGLALNENDLDFCRAVVSMVHTYGKRVIGVGVEDATTLDLLREMGVDFMQGFYIGEEGGAWAAVENSKPLVAERR
ncbi:MAG: EAL domain-containing protein [Gammaproteobacteria bacterium]